MNPSNLDLSESKKFSQNGEDGIIESIFNNIGTTNKIFVEIGVGDGRENNTRKLTEEGWAGTWISIPPVTIVPDGVTYIGEKVTIENVNEFLKHTQKEIDLLSIDIDGNDYWVWKAIKCISPRVVVIEYNPYFPPPISKTIKYDPDFKWEITDYFGASLSALDKLAKENGYSLVGCNSSGVNAFFIKDFKFNLKPEDAFRPFAGSARRDPRHWIEI